MARGQIIEACGSCGLRAVWSRRRGRWLHVSPAKARECKGVPNPRPKEAKR